MQTSIKDSDLEVRVNSNGTIIHVLIVDGKEKIHREGGPAIIYASGLKYWYKYDNFHRDDGPAMELLNGRGRYWINGKEITDKVVKWADEHSIDLNNWTEENRIMFKLYWGNGGV